ncbi:MAG: DUF2784 domain-containing protein [Verrucomicrobiota bacterium]
MTARAYLLLADAVLVVHFAFVLFVVIGLVLIWLGGWRCWAWVGNPWFRLPHVAAIGVVAAESVLGWVCPLTTWENRLRSLGGAEAYAESFVQHWVHWFLFYDFNERVFTAGYLIFFGAVLLSFWWVPPAWRRRR